MPANPSVVDYLPATIAASANTVLALADGGAVTYDDSMRSFVGIVETADVRSRGDGTDPTNSEGELIYAGSVIYLSASELQNMRFIRTGSTSATIKGHLYNVVVTELLGVR